jgi:hypothetical protein
MAYRRAGAWPYERGRGTGLRCDISKFGIILSADFPLKGNDTVTAIMGILNAEDIVARVEHEA